MVSVECVGKEGEGIPHVGPDTNLSVISHWIWMDLGITWLVEFTVREDNSVNCGSHWSQSHKCVATKLL